MLAIPQSERDSLLSAIQPYIETLIVEDDGLDSTYFDIISIGRLRIGIGSALDLKYLARVRGETDDPFDDVVLEFKQVRDLSGIDCIQSGAENQSVPHFAGTGPNRLSAVSASRIF